MHTEAAVRGALRWSVGSVSRVGTRLMVVFLETAVAFTSLDNHLRHSVTLALVGYFMLDSIIFFREIPYLAKFPTRRQPYRLHPFHHASPSFPMSNAKRTTRKDRI
ncbi:uncharacterized protein B0T23DRAFT_413644 [Neurospora hispaniola]|uniref:Uncharacterized protein n=1 Tax=Neurospora hispaniola TaxID=588809 RepID=A0AAJ0I6P0_9PEZI|nr:hypothetical protein B0T23DRAFT_413644 [Neurospora hispaniola]